MPLKVGSDDLISAAFASTPVKTASVIAVLAVSPAVSAERFPRSGFIDGDRPAVQHAPVKSFDLLGRAFFRSFMPHEGLHEA
jgi:hypothetical protein